MIGRRTHPRPLFCAACGLVLILLVAACGGDAAKYAGKWQRDLSGEGAVQMRLASNGRMELMLPSPRWPDSVDMAVRVVFAGDTMMFKADTAVSRCQTTDARYVVTRAGDTLRISGVGMDSCGGRRAALVGRWEKV